MSLTRKFLTAMGIEADKVDEIINAHVEVVDALKEERDGFKKENETLKKNAENVEDLKKELDELKKSGNPFEDKYTAEKKAHDELKAEFEKFKKGIDDEKIKSAKEKIYRDILKEAGVSEKRMDAVIRLSGESINGINLGEDNNISKEDKDKMLADVKTEWGDYIQTKSTVGTKVDNPPNRVSGDSTKPSRAQLIAERYHENLYGSNKEE